MTKAGVRRGAAEFLLIVAGILVAFGLDSWWNGLSERTEELSYLVEIREEFDSAIVQLDSLAVRTQSSADGLRRLQRAVFQGAGGLSADSTNQITNSLWFFELYEPTMPAYADLLATGLVGLTNGELRRALRRYEQALHSNRVLEGYVVDSQITSWEPALAKWVPLRRVDQDLLVPIDDLAGNLEFRNLVAMRARMDGAAAEGRADLAEAAREVVALLDEELLR